MRFLSVLALIFITLKILGVINWSWWLVLLPLYGIIAGFLVGGLLLIFVAAIILFVTDLFSSTPKRK